MAISGNFGYTWWDNEADGEFMYPPRQRNPTEEERYQVALRNPEGAAPRGLWSNQKFLEMVGSPEFNKQLKQSQFADFHSHGWIFRAVYERDRKGNLLDAEKKIVSPADPEKFDTLMATENSTASPVPPLSWIALIATAPWRSARH